MRKGLGLGLRLPHHTKRLGYLYGQSDDDALAQIVQDRREAYRAKKAHRRNNARYRRADWNEDTPRPITLAKLNLPE